MMNLDRLRALDAVASHGTVNEAAVALHVTTSAVSQQLTKLEREVGQRLLERNGRGVRLTDAAQLLAAHAARILSQVDEAEADLEAHRGAVVGHVTLAGVATAARGVAPPALRALRARYPELTVELRELEMEDSIPLTARGDVDIALVNDWDAIPLTLPESLTRTALVDDVFDLALPADHRLADREWVDLAEMAGEEWIGWAKDSICYQWLIRTLRDKGIEPWIAHTAEEHPTQLALVAAGLGVAALPRIGRSELPRGVRIVGLRPPLSRHLYATWRADTARRPAIRAVRAALRDAALAACTDPRPAETECTVGAL